MLGEDAVQTLELRVPAGSEAEQTFNRVLAPVQLPGVKIDHPGPCGLFEIERSIGCQTPSAGELALLVLTAPGRLFVKTFDSIAGRPMLGGGDFNIVGAAVAWGVTGYFWWRVYKAFRG